MNCKYCGGKLTNNSYCVRCGKNNSDIYNEEKIELEVNRKDSFLKKKVNPFFFGLLF